MFFSRPCQHAIRALVYLALYGEGAWCRVREIAEAEGLPAPALAAVLQNLARAGLVTSQKGPRGGFSLARPGDEATLFQIVEAIDGAPSMSQCAIGLAQCSDDLPCPVHSQVQEIRQRFIEHMQSVTVSDMAVTAANKKRDAAT